MLLIIAALLAVLASIVVAEQRARTDAARRLGWMSAHWLAEYRASHPS